MQHLETMIVLSLLWRGVIHDTLGSLDDLALLHGLFYPEEHPKSDHLRLDTSTIFSWLRIEFGVPSSCHVVCVVNSILHNHMLGAELIVPVDKTCPPVLRENILDGS